MDKSLYPQKRDRIEAAKVSILTTTLLQTPPQEQPQVTMLPQAPPQVPPKVAKNGARPIMHQLLIQRQMKKGCNQRKYLKG